MQLGFETNSMRREKPESVIRSRRTKRAIKCLWAMWSTPTLSFIPRLLSAAVRRPVPAKTSTPNGCRLTCWDEGVSKMGSGKGLGSAEHSRTLSEGGASSLGGLPVLGGNVAWRHFGRFGHWTAEWVPPQRMQVCRPRDTLDWFWPWGILARD